jgi:DNA (cytosine-5)-methyltransferase 1
MKVSERKITESDRSFRSWFLDAKETLGSQESGNWPDHFGSSLRKLNIAKTPGVKTLSLFSGAGGLDIGFHDAGFDIREMVEIDKSYAATLQFNSEPGQIFDGAVVHAQDVREFHPESKVEYDFIIGGPPCQTFSAAGRRAAGVKGTSDPRGILFEQYVRILEEIKPVGFLFENVYGIVGAEGGKPWNLIVDSFASAGYILSYRILDSADFGVPQHRERLFILGVRSDVHAKLDAGFRFPEPSHGPDSRDFRPFNPARSALSDLEVKNLEGTALKGRWGHLLPAIPPGLNYSFYTAEMGHPRPVFAWRSKFSDFLYKADPDMPVRTVKAQGGAYTGPLSWHNRHFTVEEFKRLQTFPDDYSISGKRSTQIQQIGNSVPPQMARVLALAVLDQVFGARLPFQVDYLEESKVLGFRSRKRLLSSRYASKALAAIEQIDSRVAVDLESEISKLCGDYSLEDDFEICSDSDLSAPSFNLKGGLSGNKLRIDVKSLDAVSSNGYALRLVKLPGVPWPLPFESVEIFSNTLTLETFTGPLKVFEAWMRETFGIEDLVQLNGYYQNKSTMSVSFTTSEESIFATAYLGLVESTLSGKVWGSMDFEKLVSRSDSHVDEVMDVFREFGFEVRNSNTNPQIPQRHYLIPYLFPTLNSRSVQRKKSLR